MAKYKIGDWLQLIGSGKNIIIKLHIIGIVEEHCCAGVQVHYDCRQFFIAREQLVSWAGIENPSKSKPAYNWIPDGDKLRRYSELEVELSNSEA